MELKATIDRAALVAGGVQKLADMLGVKGSNMSAYRTGGKPCPLPLVIRLAEIAGEDPKEVVFREVCRRAKRPMQAAVGLFLLAFALQHSDAHAAPGLCRTGANV